MTDRLKHLFSLAMIGLVGLGIVLSATSTSANTTWNWYRTDTHVHSVVSADAFVDIGIIAYQAQLSGYDAVFLTDHNGASTFQINNLNANHMAFEDTYTRWDVGTFGSLSTTVNQLASTPVNTGTSSLRLKSSSSSSGETYLWTKRGPNFRSGDIILNVSIYPTRIDPNSGVYISASIGGDMTVIQTPYGYTTQNGVVSPGKSTVLVWQLGSPRVPSSDPNARVIVYPLSYTLNQWNHYTINVSQALLAIPAADRPLDYNGLTYLKMAAAANKGTAEAYFDTYTIDASAPANPADEFVYRSSVVDDFDTPTFHVFPSYEMGQQRHTQRFNFGITNPQDYRSYASGSDGILDTQLTGYPTQLNHPGTTIQVPEVVDTQAKGAEFLEVREDSWIDAWDAILQQGTILMGSWSSDTHTATFSSRYATYLYSPALNFDDLIKSMYEGRSYNALSDFPGRVIFNPDSSSQEPYPARYPIYVSDLATSANAHLLITDGLSTSYSVQWVRNGTLMVSENPSGNSYDVTKSIPLNGPFTYVRTQVRRSSGSLRAGSQPLFFVDVPSLPAGWSFHIDDVGDSHRSRLHPYRHIGHY